jgi:hypothetical protein
MPRVYHDGRVNGNTALCMVGQAKGQELKTLTATLLASVNPDVQAIRAAEQFRPRSQTPVLGTRLTETPFRRPALLREPPRQPETGVSGEAVPKQEFGNQGESAHAACLTSLTADSRDA